MKDPFGRYRLLAQIGLGDTAEVYLAEDTGSGSPTPIVVKKLLPQLRAHAEAIELFLNEAHLALKCAHPNVRQVIDWGKIGNDYFIALEYVAGLDLGELCYDIGEDHFAAVDARIAGRVLTDVCAALDHVHSCAVIHGDVNPRNILISKDGVAKLCDFGVAVTGRGGEVRGTWAYMAPEQVRGEAFDRRVDVFAVGVILWELCAGRRLFKRSVPPQTMFAVVEDPVPPLANSEVDAIARRALAKRPAERFESCTALATALAEVIGASVDGDSSAVQLAELIAARLAD